MRNKRLFLSRLIWSLFLLLISIPLILYFFSDDHKIQLLLSLFVLVVAIGHFFGVRNGADVEREELPGGGYTKDYTPFTVYERNDACHSKIYKIVAISFTVLIIVILLYIISMTILN